MADAVNFRFGGQAQRITRAEIVRAAKKIEGGRVRKWAVEVEGRLLPLKEVFAEATGFKLIEFHTQRAQNVLTRLGFRVVDTDERSGDGSGMPPVGSEQRPASTELRRQMLDLAVQASASASNGATKSADILRTAEEFETWVLRSA